MLVVASSHTPDCACGPILSYLMFLLVLVDREHHYCEEKHQAPNVPPHIDDVLGPVASSSAPDYAHNPTASFCASAPDVHPNIGDVLDPVASSSTPDCAHNPVPLSFVSMPDVPPDLVMSSLQLHLLLPIVLLVRMHPHLLLPPCN